MTIRDVQFQDLTFILETMNDTILHSTAIYEYDVFSFEYIQRWFEEKKKSNFPVIVALNGNQYLGFATYGTFRSRTAYRTTAEHSVYVNQTFQGQGIGQALMIELISRAKSANFHTLIGGIDAENLGSIEFHKKLGFKECGRIHEVAFKFDRWLDLVFMQRILR